MTAEAGSCCCLLILLQPSPRAMPWPAAAGNSTSAPTRELTGGCSRCCTPSASIGGRCGILGAPAVHECNGDQRCRTEPRLQLAALLWGLPAELPPTGCWPASLLLPGYARTGRTPFKMSKVTQPGAGWPQNATHSDMHLPSQVLCMPALHAHLGSDVGD